MGITVNTNIAAISAYQNLNKTSDMFTTSLGRLSSGLKINTAADDAAGYVISQQLQRQSNSYGVAINNAQDGVSVLQTAQGALNQTTSILQRMNELAMRAANGDGTDNTARTADNQEFTALKTQLDQIANSTVFGGANLLNGTYNATFQVGTDNTANSTVNVALTSGAAGSTTSFGASGLGVNALDISTQAGASTAIGAGTSAAGTIQHALDVVTSAQATMGAAQNRLTVIATNLGVGQENLKAANSRLVDTDMAAEMTNFSSLQILKQVGTSMLAQAQQAPQTILKLIQ
jgi:flagellin